LADPSESPWRYLTDCIATNAGMSTLIGLMALRGIRFARVDDGVTANGTKWAAIIVQGEPDTAVLRQVADRIEAVLSEDAKRRRSQAEQG
jgi:hypothetical protein